MNKIVISGCNSGFGKYFWEEYRGCKSRYKHDDWLEIKEADVFIHCGWEPDANRPNYIEKAIANLNKINRINAKKIIFLSSVDVYPKNKIIHTEDEIIDKRDIVGIYGITKKMIEERIEDHWRNNYLILRCGALLGRYTPKNNLRIAANGQPIKISEKSNFNLITYQQLFEFINLAIERDLTGIYNIVASDNMKLKDLSILHNKGLNQFKYKTPPLSYEKFLKEAPHLIKSSDQNWIKWLEIDY